MARAGDALVVLGEVIGPYGVRGWLKVRTYTEAPDALLGYATWWVKAVRETQWRKCDRLAGRLHSGALLAQLGGVDTRELAQTLKGAQVGVPRSALPEAPVNEIYWEDLAGFAVVNRAGVLLGEVRGVTEYGAHPLLRVTRAPGAAGAERLIPFVPAIVDRVDQDAGRIDVDWGEDY